MTVLSIIVTCVVYLLVVSIINYYGNLITSKTVYSREEIVNFLPAMLLSLKVVFLANTVFSFLLFFIVPLVLGALFMYISHFFLPGTVVVVILFVLLPVLQGSIEERRVNASEYIRDDVANNFARFGDFILLGLGTGFSAAGMHVWVQNREYSFLWFAFNLIAVTVFVVLTLTRIVKKSKDVIKRD
ncbi:MAG TPA: hypothetical protein PK544_12690 [Spirochaetota bacterium]|nr:hypothetical protein [Spirochaetota bacterium]HPJ38660.1 hypothetical protein [Spirochaetota bacterium]HPQ54779.1 hypothetical protein [Spirochaetota bacterium]